MKFRRILMTGALSIAVMAAFGFKVKGKSLIDYSTYINGVCYNLSGVPNQEYCEVFFTGPQCTVGVNPIYEFEATTTPTCSKPLRQPF